MTSQTWLDTAIGWFAPEAALRRVCARQALDARLKLAYDGAKIDNRGPAPSTSANWEIEAGLPRLRDRSSDLIRNNHYAAKAQMEWCAATVGYGILGRTGIRAIDELWRKWRRECSSQDGIVHFEALQAAVAYAEFERGECFIRRRWRRASDGLAVPLQLEVLESDYLDVSLNTTYGGNAVVQGIELDKLGRRVAYHFFTAHPGDRLSGIGGNWGRSYTTIRVDAADVIHVYRPTRPGQMRGVPRLAPAIAVMRNLADWEEAELIRKRTESCMVGFVSVLDDTTITTPTTVTESGQQRRYETLRPGTVSYLRPGEAITFNTPSYAGGYEAYKTARVRDIAAAIGMPYEILQGDLSKVNYSSYRAGLLSYKRVIEQHQENVLIPAMQGIAAWFIEAAVSFGRLSATVDAAEWSWTPPAFELLDRKAEFEADEVGLRIGATTWPQVVARQGYDAETQIAEIAKYAPRLAEAGVSFSKQSQPQGVQVAA